MTQINFKSGIYKIANNLNGRCYFGSSVNLSKREKEHFRQLAANIHKNSFLQNDFNKCGREAFRFKVLIRCPKADLIESEQKFLDQYFDNQENCYNIVAEAGGNYNVSGRMHHASKPVYQYTKKGKLVSEFGNARLAEMITGANRTSVNLACNGKLKTAGGYIWRFEKRQNVEIATRKRPKKTGTTYVLISPNGEKLLTTNLTKFCEENLINYYSMFGVISGKRTSCFGWKGHRKQS